MPTLYDTVLYPTTVSPYTHPDTPATLGKLFGLDVAPVERCRVLEVGCGDGSNLIPIAHDLPESRFVGIDLAERPIAQGRARAEALGLPNLELHAVDLLDFPEEHGPFDYIIAHGVYAWVPPNVRDGLLALVKRHLAPQGVAFVSYNIYPGGHVFEMLREMMLFHVRGIDDPVRRAAQARALLHLLAEAQTNESAYGHMLNQKLKLLETVSDAYLTHDMLTEHYHPCSFFDFVRHAEAHDLRYLADADFYTMYGGALPEQTQAHLKPLEASPLIYEQYLDFIRGRAFRRSLVCHLDVTIRPPEPADLQKLSVAAPVVERPADRGAPAGVVKFEGQRGYAIQTGHPLAQAVCRTLGDAWPRRVSVDDVVRAVRPLLPDGEGDDLTLTMLFGLLRDGFLEAHRYAPPVMATPGDRPEASRMARRLVEAGGTEPVRGVPNLHHRSVMLDDDTMDLLPLLDGTRDRATLMEITALTQAELDAALDRLAEQALLVG